jgi:hypothetical protein
MPELIINPFDENGFDLATMTSAINLIPNTYGRVRQLGIFTPEPITTRTVIIDEYNGVLTLLKSQPLGAPPPRAKHGKAKTRSFIIPHIPYEDQIKPDDIQGVRQWGTGQAATLERVMLTRLTAMRASHAITEEHLLMGGVKGVILDADGSTIYNLFTEFGVSQEVVNFALTTDSTNVAGKCREVIRIIEDNLMGDVMTGVRCLCDDTFFDSLIGHPEVEKFWLNHVSALQLAGVGTDPRKGFNFGGITFEEYRATATDPTTGSARAFIAAGEAHFFPVGTQNTFKVHYAPANLMETVNTPGMPMYARQTMDQKGRWIDIYTESNPLPLCRRPKLLVKGTRTSG